ncbi:DUF58 domain-containing protein [bacterium]|nr:DUF58 domain-containing protein [bacterium]
MSEGPITNALLAELEGLRVLSRKIFRGQMRGERRSRNKGQSVEFVDFRPYLIGDDLRRIDWNLYGRLDRYFIKLFEEEEDMRLYILLDCSASMAYGSPDKFDYARRLAAGLAYIVLSNHETVSVSIFSGAYKMISTPSRGKAKIHPVLRKLNDLKAEGGSQLASACRNFAAQHRKSGLVVVISDFLMGEGVEAIAPLTGLGHQVELVQVLAPEEANPQLTGDLELVDSETGESLEVSMGSAVMKRYHARLAALQAQLAAFARRCGGDFFVAGTAVPLRDFVLGELRRGRLVR